MQLRDPGEGVSEVLERVPPTPKLIRRVKIRACRGRTMSVYLRFFARKARV